MKVSENLLYERLLVHASEFHNVIEFDPVKDKLIKLDLTSNNKELAKIDLTDISAFDAYISGILKMHKAKFGIGGYEELRDLYSRSELFSAESEPRRLHLGVDIWGQAGSKVYAPIGGRVHSFGYNNNFGDYGATVILMHQMDAFLFYTLYGHISLSDLAHLREGDYIIRGQEFAHFGKPEENGQWPPHLHFQIIDEIHTHTGDYPGVCKPSEQIQWLTNSPDPDAILNLMKFAVKL